MGNSDFFALFDWAVAIARTFFFAGADDSARVNLDDINLLYFAVRTAGHICGGCGEYNVFSVAGNCRFDETARAFAALIAFHFLGGQRNSFQFRVATFPNKNVPKFVIVAVNQFVQIRIKSDARAVFGDRRISAARAFAGFRGLADQRDLARSQVFYVNIRRVISVNAGG